MGRAEVGPAEVGLLTVETGLAVVVLVVALDLVVVGVVVRDLFVVGVVVEERERYGWVRKSAWASSFSCR